MCEYFRCFPKHLRGKFFSIPKILKANTTIAQIKQYDEEVAKSFKALTDLHSFVNDTIFTRIITCETTKEAWDKLQSEFQRSQRTWQMQILNPIREFETLKMKESESVKEFTDRLFKVFNEIRVLTEELKDLHIVKKFLVSLSKKIE